MWRFGAILGIKPGAGAWSLASALPTTGLGQAATCCKTATSHTPDLDGPLLVAAQRKINAYGQQYADNQTLSFLPAIVSTSCRMHGEFLCLRCLQARLETEAHFTAAGMSSQNCPSDSFRFTLAAFYQSLKSKVGLLLLLLLLLLLRAASKAAALRINLNIEGSGIVAAPVHAPSRAPLLLPLLLSHNIPPPRVH